MKNRLLLIFLIISCSVSFEKKILVEGSIERRKTIGISYLNFEEAINEGYYNETKDFLMRNRKKIKENVQLTYALGKIFFIKKDFKNSFEFFYYVLNQTNSAMPIYGKTLWNLAILNYFRNNFSESYKFAEDAVKSGYLIDKGFLNFLKKSPEKIYKIENNFVEIDFEYSKKKLPIIESTINEKIKEKTIIDTGASLSFLSFSLAEKLGIEISDELKSQGFGFHGRLIPVWLSFIKSVEINNLKIIEIPIMIFRDEDLTFGDYKINFGLGFHLLKEFKITMDYKKRKVSFEIYKEEEYFSGNLILLGLRAGVEVTINGAGYYNFILDTGSERTYITTSGTKKAVLSEKLNFFDVLTRGIGKAKVEYRKIEDTTIGLGGYKVWYSNIISKRENIKYVDGILGNDFLENFKVIMDFPKNKISVII